MPDPTHASASPSLLIPAASAPPPADPFALLAIEEEDVPVSKPPAFAAWSLPPERRLDGNLQRRAQMLVAASCAAVVLPIFFAYQVSLLTGGLSAAGLALLSFSLFALANPLLLRLTGGTKWPGILLSFELLAAIALFSLSSDGLHSPAFLWNLVVPWIGAVLVGPWLGFVCGGLIVLETLAFYLLEGNGLLFAQPIAAADAQWFWLLCIVEMITCIAFLAWIHESHTMRNLRQSNGRLKAAHRALARSEARFRSLVTHSSDVIALLDDKARALYISPSVGRITGFRPDELVGKAVFRYVHPDDRITLFSLARLLFDEGPQAVPEDLFIPPFRFRRATGDWCWLDATVTNLRDNPAVRAVVVHVHDVTERKHAQEQLLAAKEAAEETARMKSSFLASMSHEIRTPLTSIIGFIEVLAEEVSDEQRHLIAFIQKSGRRLLDTINSVLDLARLQAGELDPTFQEIDVVAETRDAVSLLEPLAASKNLVLAVEAETRALHVSLDPDFLRRILNNLVGNAIKFTERGGVTVEISEASQLVHLRIRDTGMGIEAGFLPHLFEEFKQQHTAHAHKLNGSGLGLAITRRLVHLMDGTIEVESTPDEGSTFIVRLPARHALPKARRPRRNHEAA